MQIKLKISVVGDLMLNNIHKGVVENGVTWGQSNKKLKKKLYQQNL